MLDATCGPEGRDRAIGPVRVGPGEQHELSRRPGGLGIGAVRRESVNNRLDPTFAP